MPCSSLDHENERSPPSVRGSGDMIRWVARPALRPSLPPGPLIVGPHLWVPCFTSRPPSPPSKCILLENSRSAPGPCTPLTNITLRPLSTPPRLGATPVFRTALSIPSRPLDRPNVTLSTAGLIQVILESTALPPCRTLPTGILLFEVSTRPRPLLSSPLQTQLGTPTVLMGTATTWPADLRKSIQYP